MRLVKRTPSVDQQVVGIACDKCGKHVLGEGGWNEPSEDHPYASMRIGFSVGSPIFRADFCRACAEDLLRHLEPWRDCIYNSALSPTPDGIGRYRYHMKDVETGKLITMKTEAMDPDWA